MIKKILQNLSLGIDNCECEFNGQKRKCKVLMVDIRGGMEYSRVFVRFDTPVIKTIRVEDERFIMGYDDYNTMIDKEVESWEEWINVGL